MKPKHDITLNNEQCVIIELKKIEGSDDSSSLAREYNDNANRLTDELLNLEKYLPFDHVLYKYNVDNPLNEFRLDRHTQFWYRQHIMSLPPLEKVESKSDFL